MEPDRQQGGTDGRDNYDGSAYSAKSQLRYRIWLVLGCSVLLWTAIVLPFIV